ESALKLAAGDAPELAVLRSDILVMLTTEYDNTERFDDARRASEQALALRERFAPDDAAAIAEVLTAAGEAAVRRDDHAAARAFLDRALQAYAGLNTVEPRDRAEVLNGLADLDNNEGKLAESLAHAQQGLAALASLPAGSPERIGIWRML